MRRYSLVPGKRPKSRYGDTSPAIAEFVRWLYFRARLKQKQIANIVGLGQGSVSRIVSGQTWESAK